MEGSSLFGRCRTHTDIIYDVSFIRVISTSYSVAPDDVDESIYLSLTVVLRYYYYNITTALALIEDAFQPAVRDVIMDGVALKSCG
jgi:hypothetical protein